MRTLQSEMKRLKLHQKGQKTQKKAKKKHQNGKSTHQKKEEKLNYVDLMGMNKRGLTRGKGGAWR